MLFSNEVMAWLVLASACFRSPEAIWLPARINLCISENAVLACSVAWLKSVIERVRVPRWPASAPVVCSMCSSVLFKRWMFSSENAARAVISSWLKL